MPGRILPHPKSLLFAARAAILLALLAACLTPAAAQQGAAKIPAEDAEWTFVRVNLTMETRGSGESVVINGRVIDDYRPRIIHVFPSTGVVIDDQGHVLTFLGYRWVDLQGQSPRIDIINRQGEKLKGQLIGIDQNIGVGVVKSLGGKLKKTPFCEQCPVKDGLTVVAPVTEVGGNAQFEAARVVSAGNAGSLPGLEAWSIRINRPLQGVGEPLMDGEHRVLGFISSQKFAPSDPSGGSTIVYHPISQLLASAEKILKSGGDIRTGWLGVFINQDAAVNQTGIIVDNVQEGSPAQKAGLRSGDLLRRYDGKDIREAKQFIRLVQDTPIGAGVALDITRDGKPATLRAQIEARKPVTVANKIALQFPEVTTFGSAAADPQTTAAAGADDWSGVELAPLPAQLADFLQVPGKTGLLVLNIGSQANFRTAGIQAGDVILSVDGKQVQNPQNFISLVRSQAQNHGDVTLRIFRKGSEVVTTIKLSHRSEPAKK
jgi:serine protease Do